MNWDLYFQQIKTPCQYWALRSTGMMWEIFPMAPGSWEEHCRIEKERNAG